MKVALFLVPKYFLDNCGLENQVHVESIAVFQQCVDLIFQTGTWTLAFKWSFQRVAMQDSNVGLKVKNWDEDTLRNWR